MAKIINLFKAVIAQTLFALWIVAMGWLCYEILPKNLFGIIRFAIWFVVSFMAPIIIHNKYQERLTREKEAVYRAIEAERQKRGVRIHYEEEDEMNFNTAWSNRKIRSDLKARYLYKERPTHFEEDDFA